MCFKSKEEVRNPTQQNTQFFAIQAFYTHKNIELNTKL